jgi:hypothetical protein
LVGSIQRIPLDGSPTTKLLDERLPFAIAIDQDTVYFVTGDPSTSSVPKSGGSATVLAVAEEAFHLVVDDTAVYWTDSKAFTVNATPKHGGGTEVLATVTGLPWSIATDGCWVYFTTDGAVMRVAK